MDTYSEDAVRCDSGEELHDDHDGDVLSWSQSRPNTKYTRYRRDRRSSQSSSSRLSRIQPSLVR